MRHVRTRYTKHPKSGKLNDSIFLKTVVWKTLFTLSIMPHYPLYGLIGSSTFLKNEYLAPMGAIFSSQRASIEIAKWFSYTVFRLFSDGYSSSE